MTSPEGLRDEDVGPARAGRRRAWRAWGVTLVAGVAVAGCAATPPAGVDPMERVDLNGVSVMPPAGQTWYAGPRSKQHVLFLRRPPEAPHIVAAMAVVDKIVVGGLVQAPIRNAQDLKALTERRFQAAAGGRFTTLQSSIRVDLSLGAQCVRADSAQEERDNPRVPGVVLILLIHTLDCLHPQTPGYVVSISYSERYPKGQRPFAPEALQAEGEPFIRSAMFTPVR